MRVALAQICSGPDVAANLELVRQFAAEASQAGARLVVFPEATMRAFGHSARDVAQPLDGPFASAVRETAAELGLTIVAGMFTPGTEAATGGEERPRVRNTLLVTDGVEVRGYDKIHLYDAHGYRESDTIEAGDTLLRTRARGLELGLATCYDVRFPPLFLGLARAGAQAIAVAASWAPGPGKAEQWRLLCRARAADSTSYVLGCGQAVPAMSGVDAVEGAPTGVGGSLVVDPYGTVVAEAGEAPQLLIADLDPELVARARREVPVLTNARWG
ncbi:carbon-nitrogen hydrolase family protein [Brachybacterium sp. EF45031]|uniref:carbon-nitrogen hydrolase family protein n=1 Tax=Brachybacterium sillae TaxID=2810536 RepID=UPI00217CD22A|nr:carbon-nitrogen hydrolase family protein [Brachybacterium sillae]MCS6711791.1 carbon-nitrogen hydrolase family protein [Brachybacterium sillae]